MRTVKHTSRFRRDYRREKSGRHSKRLDADLLEAVTLLAQDQLLPRRYFDHPLGGEWNGDTGGILTHCAMFSPDTGWHAALKMPLPDAPDITLLDHARRLVLLYLDWVTADLALRAPPKEVAYAIKLGADRLREIALAIPTASADHKVELAEDMSGEQPFTPVMGAPPPDNFFRGPLI